MITRSFGNNFEVQDLTQELAMLPNIRTPLSDLNLFRSESIATTAVTFEQTFGTLGLLTDVHRGGQVLANQDETRKLHTYAVPYFKMVDHLTGQELLGQRAYGSADQQENRTAAIERKMRRMKASAAMTSEYAKFYALTEGKIYSPSGAVAHSSFYTDFGVTRKEIGFALTTATTDVIAKIEEAIAHIQDNALTGDMVGGVVALCSPEFFAALISHAKVVAAYTYYSSTQEPLRNRLGGAEALRRTFDYAGVRFVEIRDGVQGSTFTRFIPANEAYFVPLGTEDTFVSYFAPSNKLDLVGTLGEEYYMFSRMNPNGESQDFELEFSQVHLLRRPQVVVKATKV